MTDKLQMRFVTVKGVRYLRIEDVQAFVVECGAGEETDVRWRLQAAAQSLGDASSGARDQHKVIL